jgi:hypothetical protein
MLHIIRKALARQRIKRIIRRLHVHITIQDFMDGFCEHPNWGLPAIQAIEETVKRGLASWEDIGCSKEELETICYWQVCSLFSLLDWSFQSESIDPHWHLSRQVIYGMERFRRLKKSHEELMQHFNHCKIASAFWKRIFTLLHEERPDATDDELNSYICAEQTAFLTTGALWA